MTEALRRQRIDRELQAVVGIVLRLRLAGLVVDDRDLAVRRGRAGRTCPSPVRRRSRRLKRCSVSRISPRGMCEFGAQKAVSCSRPSFLVQLALQRLVDLRLRELVEEAGDHRLLVRRHVRRARRRSTPSAPGAWRCRTEAPRWRLREAASRTQLVGQRTVLVLLDGAGTQGVQVCIVRAAAAASIARLGHGLGCRVDRVDDLSGSGSNVTFEQSFSAACASLTSSRMYLWEAQAGRSACRPCRRGRARPWHASWRRRTAGALPARAASWDRHRLRFLVCAAAAEIRPATLCTRWETSCDTTRTTKTQGNSSPLAACTVISCTASSVGTLPNSLGASAATGSSSSVSSTQRAAGFAKVGQVLQKIVQRALADNLLRLVAPALGEVVQAAQRHRFGQAEGALRNLHGTPVMFAAGEHILSAPRESSPTPRGRREHSPAPLRRADVSSQPAPARRGSARDRRGTAAARRRERARPDATRPGCAAPPWHRAARAC